MTSPLLQSAQAEERALEAELEALPTYKKLKAVRALMALYISTPSDERPRAKQAPAERGARTERANSRATVIAKAAAEFLTEHGKRAPSGEIMQALIARGFDFPGEKPTTGLASILSHSPLFDNKRKEGYGLASWKSTEPTNASVDTAASA